MQKKKKKTKRLEKIYYTRFVYYQKLRKPYYEPGKKVIHDYGSLLHQL